MPAVPFAILKLDHVVLTSRNPDRLATFYKDVLGCTHEMQQKGGRLMHLRAGSALIDIIPAPDDHADGGALKNMEHFCLRVDPFDPEAIAGHLDRNGIEHTGVLDHYGADGQGPSIYLQDPEGNRVELKGPSHTPA